MQPGLRNAAKCSEIGKQGPKGTARCARCGGLWCQIRLAAGLAGLLISQRRWGLCCLAVCRVQTLTLRSLQANQHKPVLPNATLNVQCSSGERAKSIARAGTARLSYGRPKQGAPSRDGRAQLQGGQTEQTPPCRRRELEPQGRHECNGREEGKCAAGPGARAAQEEGNRRALKRSRQHPGGAPPSKCGY